MKVVLDHLTKVFKSRTGKGTVTAVNDFDLVLPDGMLIALLGPSGCGKSTVLNLISGLETPTEGRILFEDQDVTRMPPEKREVGLVFQNYALYPHLTVLQNILFPLQNVKGAKRLTKDEMQKKALETAALVQIESYMDRKPAELSGGQQQRVAIARALVKTPNILLLDEPLSNLDARLRLKTREEIRRIQRETGVTTIFVTHDQEEAMSISDLIIVMKEGGIQQVGSPQEVYDDPKNLFVAEFLGTPPINVFYGEIRSERLYIGEEAVMDVPGLNDQEVYAAIRPEGFILDEAGPFTCQLSCIEVMGRDISVITVHPKSKEGKEIRAIMRSDQKVNAGSSRVSFSLMPHKVHLFQKESQERLYWKEEGHEKV